MPKTFATSASSSGEGSGDVSKVGTPVDNQIAVWTGDGTVEGDTNLTWDGNNNLLQIDNIGGWSQVQNNAGGYVWIQDTPTKPNIDLGEDIEIMFDAPPDTGNGGLINMRPGKAGSGGTDGKFSVQDPSSNKKAKFDTSGLATSDKTFTFPNKDGTFAMTSDIPTVPDSVDDLGPSQTGNNGKFLKTDGTNASWESIPGDQDLSGLVPYTGATTDVDLGTHSADVSSLGVNKDHSADNGIEILNKTGKQGLRIENPAETDISFSTYKTADDYVRFTFLGDGKMEWGSGAVVADTNLYRSAANTLKTDDNFVANNISAGATVSGSNTGDQDLSGYALTTRKLDDFGTPDDNTDLNANTTNHGLLLKATAPAAGLINVVGIANGETSYANKALFDATVPSTQAFGDSAATGSATVAARRDHKHAMPATTKDTTAVTGILKGNGTAISAASAGTDYVAPSGALGTPSSGTLTNCTGLPLSGVTDSTSEALGVGTIELGHASDTTIARSAAGIATIEGNRILTTQAGSTSCATSTATTIYTATNGIYLVTVQYVVNEASTPYSGYAVMSFSATNRNKILASGFGANITITASNMDIKVTQTSGITLSVPWSIVKLI